MSIHPAALPVDRLLADVTVRRRKAGGPGGQRRNKVETGASLLHGPTGIVAEATERRSFEDNRRVAVRRLRVALALGYREPVDPASHEPSVLWTARTAGARLSVSPDHADVPALLAEALDVLAAVGDELAAAAAILRVTPSRLLRVLELEPAALAALNRRRVEQGLHPWR